MIRRKKLLQITDMTQQVCCTVSQTGCNCSCSCCEGCNDCIDCPNLTIADISIAIYRSGNVDINGNPIPPILLYPAFTFQNNVVCFYLDSQILAFPPGRYTGQVTVQGATAGYLDLQLGVPFSVCDPYTTPELDTGNDMQP
jgi:hypothetical protein